MNSNSTVLSFKTTKLILSANFQLTAERVGIKKQVAPDQTGARWNPFPEISLPI